MAGYQRTYYERNRERILAQQRTPAGKAKRKRHQQAYAAKNRERLRAAARLRTYGLDLAGFDALLVSQEWKCAVCRAEVPGGRGNWHVDHCHATGRVRGILCAPCNLGLGSFKDDPARLDAAAAYLRR